MKTPIPHFTASAYKLECYGTACADLEGLAAGLHIGRVSEVLCQLADANSDANADGLWRTLAHVCGQYRRKNRTVAHTGEQ